jgi:hypothetical protein
MKGKTALISLAVLVSAVFLVGFGFSRSGGQSDGEAAATGGRRRLVESGTKPPERMGRSPSCSEETGERGSPGRAS